MKSISKIKVRYAETDAMQVVHHANYYIYFEVAREDFIEQFGVTYKEIEDQGIMMPLVETQCKYIDAARYGDNLIIETEYDEITPIKVSLKYTVKRENDNKLVATGKTLQTFVDSKTFKIINIKKVHPEIWSKLTKY
ncbi:acyl-CoA thioesterase [Clostridium perfringens]|uniref:acyl-CoA thioesterase n=1 Tax=Clostridium perfringens TaxID=1502 RepID=UPI0024BD1CDA|nr:thioesterase family protein [Clostridium perfringens]